MKNGLVIITIILLSMSQNKKQTVVDLFHDRMVELIAGKKSITTNSIAKVWIECKAMEREQIEEAFKHGNLPTLLGRSLTAKEYYEETYGKEA